MDNFMQRCYFVDIDKTTCKEATTEELFPGAFDKINKLYDEGYHICLFTSRPSCFWEDELRYKGLRYHSILRKPLAMEYYIYTTIS